MPNLFLILYLLCKQINTYTYIQTQVIVWDSSQHLIWSPRCKAVDAFWLWYNLILNPVLQLLRGGIQEDLAAGCQLFRSGSLSFCSPGCGASLTLDWIQELWASLSKRWGELAFEPKITNVGKVPPKERKPRVKIGREGDGRVDIVWKVYCTAVCLGGWPSASVIAGIIAWMECDKHASLPFLILMHD